MAVNNARKPVVYRRDKGGFDYYGDNNKRHTVYHVDNNYVTVKDNPFDQRRFGGMTLGRNSDGSIYYTGTINGSTYKFFDNGRVANTKTGQMGTYSSAPGSNKFAFTWDNAPANSSVVNNSDERPGVTTMKELTVTAAKPTYHVGGLNISDGIQQGIGLTPKVDMLGLTKSPTTDSETTPQPDYMRFVNPVMPYVQNYFRAQNNTTKFPMKELPVEGLTFNKVYNKRDTRQWLWDQGIDPYTLTGRQRRKIRNDLNATGTTNFKINGVTPIVMKKGSKLIKKEEVCPKCGKIHKAGIGCTIDKFRYDNGGNIRFMQQAGKMIKSPVKYNPMVHGISRTKPEQQLIDEYNERQNQITTLPEVTVTPETNAQRIVKKASELAGNLTASVRVPVKAAYNWLTSPVGTNMKNNQAFINRNKNSLDLGQRFLGLKNRGSLNRIPFYQGGTPKGGVKKKK